MVAIAEWNAHNDHSRKGVSLSMSAEILSRLQPQQCSSRAYLGIQRHDMGPFMSSQEKFDFHNHLSNQPSIVGSKHNEPMQYANPRCSRAAMMDRPGPLRPAQGIYDMQQSSEVGSFFVENIGDDPRR